MKQLGSLLPFVLIALVFWLLIVRPQRRRQQELSSTQASLGPGVEVMLGSGIFGTPDYGKTIALMKRNLQKAVSAKV